MGDAVIMCNFFTRHREPRNLAAAFRFPELPNDPPRYVVRPTDTERVVAVGKDGQRHAVPMRWGLVPYWDIKTGLTLFNWQSETVMQKSAFAEPFKRGRLRNCVSGSTIGFGRRSFEWLAR
jgi:putative SOS response-associated peptidase YedK